MKNLILSAMALVLCSCAALDPAESGATDRAVSVMYGRQAFEEEAIDDDVQADTIGVQYEYVNPSGPFGDEDSPIVSEVGVFYGHTASSAWVYGQGGPSNEFDVSMDTYEILLGLRKDWRLGRVTPFIGAGLDFMLADVEALGGSDQDFNVGGYAKAGLRFALTERLSLGTEARYRAFGDFEVGDDGESVSGDLSGLAGLVSLTWSF